MKHLLLLLEMEFSMDLKIILFITLIIILFIIPLRAFIIKSAVKQGILEAYKIIKNDKDKNIFD